MVGITPVAPSKPPWAVILTEEVAKDAHIGGSNEAQEGEDEGVDRDHFFNLVWVGCGLLARAREVILLLLGWDTRFTARPELVFCVRNVRERIVGELPKSPCFMRMGGVGQHGESGVNLVTSVL